jgi:hypothetical protein
MHQFIAKHQEQIVGVLSGFDRVVFRGTLRPIAYAEGMRRYLRATHVLLKDFGRHVEEVSNRLKEASLAQARALGRPVTYLASSQTDKDALVRRIMAADGITRGLVGVLSCVEPCQSFEMRRDRNSQKLVVEARYRTCLFLSHYWVHPVLGFMNARIQTWFPFAIPVGLNGREWLARQLEATGLRYVRRERSTTWRISGCTGPRQGTPMGSGPGGSCAGGSPISTGGQRSPGRPPSAIWTPWPVSMTTPRWTNCSTASASPRSGTAAGSGPSVPSAPTIGPCSPP